MLHGATRIGGQRHVGHNEARSLPTRRYSAVSLALAIEAAGPAYRAVKPRMALKYC